MPVYGPARFSAAEVIHSDPRFKDWTPRLDERYGIPDESKRPIETTTNLFWETRALVEMYGHCQSWMANGVFPADRCAYFVAMTIRLRDCLERFSQRLKDVNRGRVCEYAGTVDYSFHHLAIAEMRRRLSDLMQSLVCMEHRQKMAPITERQRIENIADIISEGFKQLSQRRTFPELDCAGLVKRLEIEWSWLQDECDDEKQHLASQSRFSISTCPDQITLDGKAYALTHEQSVYLSWLTAKKGDRRSDAEFRDENPDMGESARPDRWRKSLPEPILKAMDTNSKGTRWLA